MSSRVPLSLRLKRESELQFCSWVNPGGTFTALSCYRHFQYYRLVIVMIIIITVWLFSLLLLLGSRSHFDPGVWLLRDLA